jgi:uncharacterized protein with PQ loop repeat
LTFEFILKVLAIGSNVLLQLSPMRLVTEFRLRKSTGDLSVFPLIALTACGFQWSFYGYFAFNVTGNSGFLMLVYANILGFVLGCYYVLNFTIYSNQRSTWAILRDPTLIILSIMFMIEVVWCNGTRNFETSLKFSGGLSALLSVLVSASTMVAIPKVLSSNSLESLPVDMVVASFGSSVLWLACGYLLGDPWVWAPNASGVIIGAMQIGVILHVTYPTVFYVLGVRSGLKIE